MKAIIPLTLLTLLAIIAGPLLWNTKHMPPTPAAPAVTSVVQASVTSLQTQNKLLVLTSTLNGVATSEQRTTGMLAQRTDILSEEVEFFIDLSSISDKSVVQDGRGLVITLPKTALYVVHHPKGERQTYDNGSWLFTWDGGLRDRLKVINDQKLNASFIQQAKTFEAQARNSAQVNIRQLLTTTLQVAGFTQAVHVVFV